MQLPEKIDLPVSTGDYHKNIDLCLGFLNEIQPTGQSIGRLHARMARCRRTDSKLYIDLEKRCNIFENNMSEMISFLRMTLYFSNKETGGYSSIGRAGNS